MSISTINRNITRTNKEIADLAKKITQEEQKKIRLQKRIHQITKSIKESTSASAYKSKMSEINRKESEIFRIQQKEFSLLKKQTDMTRKLHKYEESLQKETKRENDKLANAEKKRRRQQAAYQQRLRQEISRISQLAKSLNKESPTSLSKEYDIFIAHASADKDGFVQPLVDILCAAKIKVWYDNSALQPGDSLRRSIDFGLVNSRYGAVVLSPSFFGSNWSQRELDGMVSIEMESSHKVILPIWHGISQEEILKYSPPLADKVALNSSVLTVEEIADKLIEVIRSSDMES